MKLLPKPDGTCSVIVEAVDRRTLEKAVAVLKIIIAHDKREDTVEIARSSTIQLASLLANYPDTRKPKTTEGP